MYDELVPEDGEASTNRGEILRSITKLSYDYFNNGNCNVVEVGSHTETFCCQSCEGRGYFDKVDADGEPFEDICADCYGSGEYDEEIRGDNEITPFYEKMIVNLLAMSKDFRVGRQFMKMMYNAIANLEQFLLWEWDFNFPNEKNHSEKNIKIYNTLMDYVMWYITTFNEEDCTRVLETRT